MNESDKALAMLAGVNEEAIRCEISRLEDRLGVLRPLAELVARAWRENPERKADPAKEDAAPDSCAESGAGPPVPKRQPRQPKQEPLAGELARARAAKAKPASTEDAPLADDGAKQRRLLGMLAGGPLSGPQVRERFGVAAKGKLPDWTRHPWFGREEDSHGRQMLSLSAAGRKAAGLPDQPAPAADSVPIPAKWTGRARALRILATGVHTDGELRSRLGLDDGLPLPLEGDAWFFKAVESGETTWRLSAQGREALAEGAGKIGEGG